MDKFVTSLPRGVKRKASSVKTLTASKPMKRLGVDSSFKQTYLDLGQKDFGKMVQCKMCACLYMPGDADDEAMHRAFCAKKKKGLSLSTLRGHQVCTTLGGDRKVVEVVAGSHKSELADVKAALKVVRQELGSQSDFGPVEGTKYYLYLSGLLICGVAVVESVSSVMLVLLSDKRRTCHVMTKSTTAEGGIEKGPDVGSEREDGVNSADSERVGDKRKGAERDDDEEKEELALGVSMIWVDEEWRRKGVAAQLCDSARRRFMYGTVVPRSKVAFSQPTEAGHAFALGYSGTATDGADGAEPSYLAYH